MLLVLPFGALLFHDDTLYPRPLVVGNGARVPRAPCELRGESLGT